MTKTCGRCKCRKSADMFNKCQHGTMGLHGHCRSCQKIIKREYYIKNREKELKVASEYSKTEKAAEHRRHKWATNKHRLGPKHNARRRTEDAKAKARIQRSKWMTIPENRIACNLRARIRQVLKGRSKSKTTEKLLGCSFEFLKNYLEQKFTSGMSWENYGSWHIDHIKPLSAFNLSIPEELEKASNYKNLQPLWEKDNLSKGGYKVIN